MRSVLVIVFALLALQPATSNSPAQKVLEEKPYYLRADKRLWVTLNVEPDHPKLAQIVAQLGAATGLSIAVDRSLDNHAPDYGYIQPSKRGYYAWQIMEMVDRKDLQKGFWEKTARGYRLVGTSLAVPNNADEASPFTLLWGVLAPLPILLLVFLARVHYRRRLMRQGQAESAQNGAKPEMPKSRAGSR